MSTTSAATNPILIISSTSLAAWLSVALSIPSPYMCIVTCYVLTNIYAHEIYLKSSERITGAIIAVAILNLIISLGSQHIMLQQLLFLLAILGCLYLHFLRFRPYAMLIASIVLAFTMATELNTSSNVALMLGESWTIDVLLGSLIAVSLNIVVKIWHDFGRVAPIDNIRFEFEMLFTSLKQRSRLKESLVWDKTALIKSMRIIFIFFFIVALNHLFGIRSLTIQALIGAAVVSVQLTFEHSHRKYWHRVFGAVLGAILALLTLKVIEIYPIKIHWIWLVEAWLCILLLLMRWQPQRKYLYFQAGLLVIMLLTGVGGQHMQSIDIAWQRALGNVEGGLISLVLIFISDRFVNKGPDE